jgi:hypothetical protein
LEKAAAICDQLQSKTDGNFLPVQTDTAESTLDAIKNSDAVFAAGAAGVELLPGTWLEQSQTPRIVVDLNAVPPAGIAGVEVTDGGKNRGNTICYGAIGVGGLKMKIHKLAIKTLFETNDRDLDVEEIYELGKGI